MKELFDGIAAFQTDVFPEYRELFRSPGFGRSPELLLITCADSGIDPNLITQTDPGELIVCSNLGNVVPPFGSRPSGEWACIEYALSELGVQHIAVCGHTDCGAIKVLLKCYPDLPISNDEQLHEALGAGVLEILSGPFRGKQRPSLLE